MNIIKDIAAVIIVASVVIFFGTLLVVGIRWVNKDEPAYHKAQVERTLECIERINDKEWCLKNLK